MKKGIDNNYQPTYEKKNVKPPKGGSGEITLKMKKELAKEIGIPFNFLFLFNKKK
jgi:hypothetical protein